MTVNEVPVAKTPLSRAVDRTPPPSRAPVARAPPLSRAVDRTPPLSRAVDRIPLSRAWTPPLSRAPVARAPPLSRAVARTPPPVARVPPQSRAPVELRVPWQVVTLRNRLASSPGIAVRRVLLYSSQLDLYKCIGDREENVCAKTTCVYRPPSRLHSAAFSHGVESS